MGRGYIVLVEYPNGQIVTLLDSQTGMTEEFTTREEAERVSNGIDRPTQIIHLDL